MHEQGLYVELGSWGYNFFECERTRNAFSTLRAA
jgi:hypothetical protein